MKTKRIEAVSIALADGVEAVFVQSGDEWKTLREFVCIAPVEFKGETLITAPIPGEGRFTQFFSSAFGRLEQREILMSSPGIAAAIKAAEAAEKP